MGAVKGRIIDIREGTIIWCPRVSSGSHEVDVIPSNERGIVRVHTEPGKPGK